MEMDFKQFFDYKLKNIMDQVKFAEYVTDSVTSEMIDGYAAARKELSIFIDDTERVINSMYSQDEKKEIERLKIRDLQNEAKYYSMALKGLIEYGPY
jgi:hypothetical protein